MNPQQLSGMDPKLREAYERIMGLAVAPKAATATPPISSPSQIVTPPVAHDSPRGESSQQAAAPSIPSTPLINQTPSLNPSPTSPTPTMPPIPATNIAPSIGINGSLNSFISQSPPTAPAPVTSDEPRPNTESVQPQFDPIVANNQMHAYVSQEVAGVKQSLKIIQLIYIVGGLMFFGVYALFWMKFFNIPSPF